ncbi:MAG TPA: hypothetical protein VL095_01750, partial [Flavisolibacter sp.]|nr:hypothetical protein [Flavisolibacter sp.]
MKYLQRSFLFRFYFSRTDAEQILILSNLFSVGLVIFRMIYTGHLLFAFLVWNLFLAFVPYVISRQMAETSIKSKWKLLFYAFVWL